MAIRRMQKKTHTIATVVSAPVRRAQPRAVAVAARQRFLEHTQRGGDIEDIESPGSPVTQDPAGDLSAPIPQRNSEPAVTSVVD